MATTKTSAPPGSGTAIPDDNTAACENGALATVGVRSTESIHPFSAEIRER